MRDVAIHCEGLSKQYRIGPQEKYRALRDVISESAAAPFRRFRSALTSNGNKTIDNRQSATGNSIWALDDISFEIKRGDVVGIIGRNGAGKSTLLKILSRITKPTRGHAVINGRVGSLLEVGTGFHPELTGRENIYLNGAILGMRKVEIARKFDEIVAFAEVEQFLDTPVKRYSSGMYVRLAFAVAAHMETEILLVDEVLAVGDAQFQKKCFTKISDIRCDGRTIALVSHNLAAVRSICNRGLKLQRGRATEQGEINQVVDSYLSDDAEVSQDVEVETNNFVIEDFRVLPTASPVIKTFEPCEIRVRFRSKIEIGDPGLYVGVLTNELQRLSGLDFKDFASLPRMRAGESVEIGFNIESLPLLPGLYRVEIHLKDMSKHLIEFVPRHYQFEVVETPVYGSRRLDRWFGNTALTATPLMPESAVAAGANNRALEH